MIIDIYGVLDQIDRTIQSEFLLEGWEISKCNRRMKPRCAKTGRRLFMHHSQFARAINILSNIDNNFSEIASKTKRFDSICRRVASCRDPGGKKRSKNLDGQSNNIRSEKKILICLLGRAALMICPTYKIYELVCELFSKLGATYVEGGLSFIYREVVSQFTYAEAIEVNISVQDLLVWIGTPKMYFQIALDGVMNQDSFKEMLRQLHDLSVAGLKAGISASIRLNKFENTIDDDPHILVSEWNSQSRFNDQIFGVFAAIDRFASMIPVDKLEVSVKEVVRNALQLSSSVDGILKEQSDSPNNFLKKSINISQLWLPPNFHDELKYPSCSPYDIFDDGGNLNELFRKKHSFDTRNSAFGIFEASSKGSNVRLEIDVPNYLKKLNSRK